MTHLNIQQGLNIEVVTTLIIKKLYEAALSVPEPLEGELDAAYMSGNLLVGRAYRALVEYLTNRFDDLHINVTDSYYIPFEDSAVLNVLLANNIGSDGIGVTEAEAANATFTSSTFQDNTDITSFDEFKYFTKANTNPPNLLFMGCSNLSSVDLSNVTTLSSEEFKQTALTNIVLLENVTTIPNNCFLFTPSLLSVTAPGVLVINGRAFDLCTGLTSFSDFSNVTTIGENAFLGAPLTGVFNAPNLTALGILAFLGHRFEGIECIGTISSIPHGCFSTSNRTNNLLYVYLPYECTSLENTAFRTQTALATIKQYDKTISAYQEGETKTFLPDLSKITSFGNACFRECFALPLTGADLVNATNIGSECFYLSSLSGALTLSHLTSLGSSAFYSCPNITSVDLTGSTITSIPESCFNECTSLTSVTLPSTCLIINLGGFRNCSSLTTLNAQNVKTITGFYSLRRVAVSNLALPAIETIGQRSLSDTRISVLDLGPNLSSIGNLAFWESTYTTFIFRGTTVPTFNMTNSSGKFLYNMNNVAIYVPESALSDYQTAWPAMASNMVKIEGSVYDTQS